MNLLKLYFKKLEVYDQDTFRPYCHVKDFANIILKVIRSKNKVNNQIFNCGITDIIIKLSIAKKISKYSKIQKLNIEICHHETEEIIRSTLTN